MKTYITLFTIASFFLFSCEREIGLKYEGKPVNPSLMSPNDNSGITFTQNTEDSTVTFTWATANFGFQASIDYIIQIAPVDSNFKVMVPLGKINNLGSYTVSFKAFNTKLISLGFLPAVTDTIEYRIAATINKNVDTIYSQAYKLIVTPYITVIKIDPIYLLGDGCEAGWDNNTKILVKPTGKGGQFVTFAKLTKDKNIKFIANLGNWDPMWGGGAAGTLVYRPKGAPDVPTIPTTLDGYCKIIADTALLTYEVKPYSMGIAGSAAPNGWDGPDFTMKFNYEKYIWTAADVTLKVGKLKFRLDNAWTTNWGGDINNLTAGGADIDIAEAGTYSITLSLPKEFDAGSIENSKCVITKK